jgi:hypothetical protein
VYSVRFLPICKLLCISLFVMLLSMSMVTQVSAYSDTAQTAATSSSVSASQQTVPPPPSDIQLDSRLPMQTVGSQSGFANINAKFGSRFDFTVLPNYATVRSGTDGVFHDNAASYVVGISPTGLNKTFIFHMGALHSTQGDAYVLNEHWIEGLNTSRWAGDATDGEGMHIIVDIIDTFHGEPGCTTISVCANAIKDDTAPFFIVGITLQNGSTKTLSGKFVFGSNRALAPTNGCVPHITPAGKGVNIVSYDPSADVTGGTLFLAGDGNLWNCNTSLSDRAGLAWNYQIPAFHTSTQYLILGSWNTNSRLFVNGLISSPTCQNEALYTTQEFLSETDVVDFAFSNLTTHDNLLGQAQVMENYLIQNNVLTTAQRWLIGDSLRSYKASTWLMARQACGGGGYDAAVYEGSYGFLTTVDVMHEYGYFEITRVPWFFKAAISTVFANARTNNFGLYFQHDQGADVDSFGDCMNPGQGTPTFRASCYAPPKVSSGLPMPTEEDSNVALLMAYYAFVTGDTAFIQQHIGQIDAAMQHNIKVGDPNTGIAYNFQDTNTTYDAASDCLHNNAPGAGNLYYQGLKEATGYRAAAYLDGLVGDTNGTTWTTAAAKIENAMVAEYNSHGFIPIATNTAFNNCNGRTVTLGEGLFYAHLIGQDQYMNQTLLHDLASQYPSDLSADTLSSPSMIAMTSTAASGPQCSTGHCHRYEWFSKVILSSVVADMVYTKYGCTGCARVDAVEAAYSYNFSFSSNFGDGFHDDGSDWGGHFYPRGIISWAFLSSAY